MSNNWLVTPLSTNLPDDSSFESMIVDGLAFYRAVDGRFGEDKAFITTKRHAIVLDGVILNKTELLLANAQESLAELLDTLLLDHGVVETLKRLRGPFSGAILDRKTRMLYSFANQTGDTAAYLYSNSQNSALITSNSFDLVMRVAQTNEIATSFNVMAARFMLSFGYMLDGTTFAKEVERILPGQVISTNLRDDVKSYSSFSSFDDIPPFDGSREEAVMAIDQMFKKAVARCFDKDIEYGYEAHLVDISGGLDSRMTNWVAHDLGYRSVTNMCFAQPGSDELKMALAVAKRLGNDLLVMPLDSGNYFADAKSILRVNGSAAFYAGITGGKRFLESLDFNHFGLEHTGQLGDVVLGTFLTTASRDQPPIVGNERYSNTVNFDFQSFVSSRWTDREKYLMDTRAFLGAMSTHATRKEHTYAVSPFIDVDFMRLCFSLPSEWRLGHRIYGDWLRSHYPDAAALSSSRVIPSHLGSFGYARWTAGRVVRRLSRMGRSTLHKLRVRATAESPNSMNPFDYWFATDERIRAMINAPLDSRIPIDAEIDKAIDSLADSGRVVDKLLATSVVTTFSMYFATE